MEMKAKTHARHSGRLEVTAPVESTDTTGRLSLSDQHWLEKHWESSGFPISLWMRLHRIDGAARGAACIARILAIDAQNADLVENCEVEYERLASCDRGGLEDALLRLSVDVEEGLEDLRRLTRHFIFTGHRKVVQP